MIQTVIYFALLAAIMLYSLIKGYGQHGILLMSLYTGIAGFAIYCVQNDFLNRYVSQITMMPYILLVLSYLIYMCPFLKRQSCFSSVKIGVDTIDKKYYLFIIVYLVCALISIANMLPNVINSFSSSAWAANYAVAVQGTGESVFTYQNRLEWLATQISGYTSLLAIILAFLYLRDDRHKKIAILTICVYSASTICTATYSSSRSIVFQLLFKLAALYLFVRPELGRKIKFIVTIFVGVIVTVIMAYIIGVTVSRFTKSGALNSMLEYLGQAPLVFNGGIENISKLSWGMYSLGALFDAVDMSQALAAWNNGFYTYVGWIYVDWGFIGVILIGVILALIFNYIVNKEYYRVSDLLLIFYYYNFLVTGAFVIGPQQIINIVMMLLLYIILRVFVENKIYVCGNLRL